MTTQEIVLLTAAAVHFGFQATVTAIVYPALARVPAAQWDAAHRAHSRVITPLVVIVYGGLAGAGGWALLSGPGGWTLVALAALGLAVLVTAFAAAPAHGRLGAGHDPDRIAQLLKADRVRALAATVAFTAAALAAH